MRQNRKSNLRQKNVNNSISVEPLFSIFLLQTSCDSSSYSVRSQDQFHFVSD